MSQKDTINLSLDSEVLRFKIIKGDTAKTVTFGLKRKNEQEVDATGWTAESVLELLKDKAKTINLPLSIIDGKVTMRLLPAHSATLDAGLYRGTMRVTDSNAVVYTPYVIYMEVLAL